MESKFLNISVVIATIGGESIYETIRTINSDSIIP